MTAHSPRHTISYIFILVTVTASSLASPKHNSASSPLERAITLDFNGIPLRRALSEIESKAGVKFGYSDVLIDSVNNTTLHVNDRPISEFLPEFLGNLQIAYEADESGHITLFKRQESTILGFIAGSVSDGTSHTPIGGATIEAILNGEARFRTTSLWDGSFKLQVPEGAYSIRVDGMEFVRNAKIKGGQGARFNIRLKGASLPPVEVYATSGPRVDRNEFEAGFHTLQPSLEAAPHLGTSDLFQDIQALPGVGVFNDYSSKLFIRGSPPGQILFLLDGVPIEMPYHLFGMVGVFNPGIVEQVNLSSGVFSARYGDRVGGVVDIQTKKSTSKGLGGTIGLNPATTSLTVRGQLTSNMDVLLGGRYSHHNFASQVFRGDRTPYYFGDVYSKLTFRPSSRNRLSLNGFYSGDRFLKLIPIYHAHPDPSRQELDKAGTEFSWYSWRVGTNWIYEFSSSSRLELGYSRSQNYVKNGKEHSDIPSWAEDNFTNSYIARQAATADLSREMGASHRIRLGTQLVHHQLEYAWRRLDFQMSGALPFVGSPPSPLSIFFESAGDELNYRRTVLQLFSYVENIWQPVDALTVEAGLRFEKRSFVKKLTVAPRINLAYKVRENLTAKAAYGKFYQGLTTAIDDTLLYMLPLLIPLESDLKLQTANHYLAGLQMDLHGIRLSVDGYYKKIDNQLTFFTTANDTAFQRMISRSILSRFESLNIVSRLSQGTAADYGIEFGLQKFGPRFRFNLNYRFSYSRQDLPSIAKLHGNFSPADQRHMLKAYARYDLGESWNLGVRWALTSGRPMIVDGLGTSACPPENPCRYPTYHRLDVNFAKSFSWNGLKLMAYLQLPDIYRHRGVENLLFYELDWGQGSQASKRMLFPTMPVVPTFGLNVEF